MRKTNAAAAKNEMKSFLDDQKQRLNTLYNITDKAGQVIPFRMNHEQERMFDEMHFLNLVLKCRQFGGTTFIDIFSLDRGNFNPNQEFVLSAHKLDDGKKIFQTKILDPWKSMRDELRVPSEVESKTELILANGSAFRVTTSARSGTTQILHVSEFGYTCARNPDKAKEIVTGSLNAVDQGQIVFIESTAMGRLGYFYQYCMEGLRLARMMKKLTSMEWKLFFFPWHEHPEYQLSEEESKLIVITQDHEEYFGELAAKHGIKLTDRQKTWYVTKLQKQASAEDMAREYPSFPEEAFKVSTEGSYYGKEVVKMYAEKRICDVPHDPRNLVQTAWDLGRNDENPIIFFQENGPWIDIIDFYENQGEGLPHYAGYCQKKAYDRGFVYGKHFAPHDIEHHDYGTGDVRKDTGKKLGIRFTTIPRIRLNIEGIEAVREILPRVRIDEKKCQKLILCLENFRKKWDEKNQVFMDDYVHDEYSHGAKAMESLALGIKQGLGRESFVYHVQAPSITCRPFNIPKPWKRCFGLSVGWDGSAVIWGVLDPEGDILYAIGEHWQQGNNAQAQALVIKNKGAWIPGAMGTDDLRASEEEEHRIRRIYLDLGLDLHAASPSAEAGILDVTNRLATGRLVVFNTLSSLLDEYEEFRRTDKGQLRKDAYHLNALRHLVTTGVRYSISEGEYRHLMSRSKRGPAGRHVAGDSTMGY
jgi:hypothetical protein